MDDLMNPAQRASVTITLKLMEENLRQAYQWLNTPEFEGILFRRGTSLTEEQRTKILEEIAEGLDLIAQMAGYFDLQPIDEDLGAAIRGQMSADWANLMDTRAKKLARFGKVEPRLAQVLDPGIERLALLAIRLVNLV
jgi:hypothetical protein